MHLSERKEYSSFEEFGIISLNEVVYLTIIRRRRSEYSPVFTSLSIITQVIIEIPKQRN